MFSEAYKIATAYTRPIVISERFFDTTVTCGLGAFIVLNDEGWIITAAHMWDAYFQGEQSLKEISEYSNQLQSILQDNIAPTSETEKIGSLKTNPKWITNYSYWWANDGVVLDEVKGLPDGDIVIGKLKPFDPASIAKYPVFKDPSKNMSPGTSLCKLGFPFYDIEVTYDEKAQTFAIQPGAVPPPVFPIEGIYTRNAIIGKSKDGKYMIKMIETSSPGLRGQSGGPIFDVKGTIWGMQVRTNHFPLGFSPRMTINGKEVEENQFLNVGLGLHPELITSFLKDNGIKFNISDY